jgi:2-polyprenyl-3-methyl-5-hydroxy-6-metoxy-1,4-benzoquinol methylase
MPFSEWPLGKFTDTAVAVPFGELAGGRLLAIGYNAGYNSIHAALKYQFSATGVDVIPRHIEAVRFLAALAGASCEFDVASAETFSRPGEFDIVLHFGTLYHPQSGPFAPPSFREPESRWLHCARNPGL